MDPASSPAPPKPDASPIPPPTNASPIMDVVVQRAPSADEAAQPGLVADSPAENQASEAAQQTNKKPSPKAHALAPAKPKGSGVGLAITATVIIILGLAAMAVYAYMQAA